MAEGSRLVQVGTVGGSSVMVDAKSLGRRKASAVVAGGNISYA